MIKTYYKFQLDKEALITTAQEMCNGCVTWIYIDAIGEPDLNPTTVKLQDWSFIAKWIAAQSGTVIDPVEIPAKDLDWFLIEKLRDETLQWQYYDKFYIL